MAFTKISVSFCMIVVMTLMTSSAANHSHPCKEPSDLRDQWNRLYTDHVMGELDESFYILPFLRQAANNHTQRYNFRRHVKRTVFNRSSTSCPPEADNSSLQDGDPCPVYHTLNVDPYRYPRTLLEAQCQCKQCKGISRNKGVLIQKKEAFTSCEKVYRYVKVLRRLSKCADNVYQYAQAWEKLRIGCTCRLVPVD